MLRRLLSSLLSLAAFLLVGPAFAQPSADAGPNQQITFPDPAQLDGDVQLSSISFWIADGDGPTEDHVVTYDSVAGLGTIGPLNYLGAIYGWPSDLIRVGPVIYGVDTSKEKIYTLDETTGDVTPLGPGAGKPSWDTRMGSLAYDGVSGLLYSVDWRPDWDSDPDNDLYTFDLVQLAWTKSKNLPFHNVLGLAWNPLEELLYLYDADSGEIHTVESDGGSAQFVVAPVHAPGDFYDEISFVGDELYGTLHIDQSGTDVIQVRRIDLATGAVEDVGPQIVGSDGHSLMIESLTETVEWSVDSGPGIVALADETDPDTTASFSAPGLYVLRLTLVGGVGPPISDTVDITVATACNDDLDNDQDGFEDFPDDKGCESLVDESEWDQTGAYPCDDGIDNDGDHRIDYPDDPGCANSASMVENPECQDGQNNDLGHDPNPGLIDFDGGQSIHGYCSDGTCPPGVSDPDGNGVANPDPQCVGKPWKNAERKLWSPCGLGIELALLLPPLMWLSRRRPLR